MESPHRKRRIYRGLRMKYVGNQAPGWRSLFIIFNSMSIPYISKKPDIPAMLIELEYEKDIRMDLEWSFFVL